MSKNKTESDIQKTALRLPRELHGKIIDASNASGRSMNAEIVRRLELSFEEKQLEMIENQLSTVDNLQSQLAEVVSKLSILEAGSNEINKMLGIDKKDSHD